MNKVQVVLLSIFISISSFGFELPNDVQISEEKLQQVSESPGWRKLMHYRRGVFGLRSDIDGDDFFFAKNGKTQPLEELKASLFGLYSAKRVGKFKLPIRCSFPERTRFLNETFDLKLQALDCPRVDEYMKQFNDPQSLSLIFSSAYPNNPASMFGHTFLKVNSARNTDLLDIGFNYAAVVPEDENGFAFVWFGTTGGYPGVWSTQPYYVKVREYSNFESRDLWDYKLNLTKDEVVRILYHIWELEVNSNTEYYFFDENCSYQVLAAIEAIKPGWDLMKYKVYLIPGESVKYVAEQPGTIAEVKYRPSLFNRINSRYEALNENERFEFQEVQNGKKSVEKVENRLAAEALITYYDFVKNDRPKFFEKTYGQALETIRMKRAELGMLSAEEEKRIPEIKGTTRPDLGHDSYSIQIGPGYYSSSKSDLSSSYLGIKFKTAYHDLLNNDLGYTQYAHIDFPYIEARYFEKNRQWVIEEIGGISTTSVSPVTDLKTPISFRGSVSYKRMELGDKMDFHALHGEVGGGLSFYFYDENSRLYAFLMGSTDISDKLHRGYSLLPGIETGFLINPWSQYKLQGVLRTSCDLMYSHNCYGLTEYELNHSWSISRNRELRNINKWKEKSRSRNSSRVLDSGLYYIQFFN